MLEKRHGKASIAAYHEKNIAVRACSAAFDAATCQGNERIIYSFGESVMDHTALKMTQESMRLTAFSAAIELPTINPYDA